MMNRPKALRNRLHAVLFPMVTGVLACTCVQASDDDTFTVTLELGDYRISPDRIEVAAGTPVRLALINKDGITPHNFTLKDESGGLDLDVDVSAGKTRQIDFVPQIPGTYPFYCNKKLPFMKSHRDRGMRGILVVTGAD